MEIIKCITFIFFIALERLYKKEKFRTKIVTLMETEFYIIYFLFYLVFCFFVLLPQNYKKKKEKKVCFIRRKKFVTKLETEFCLFYLHCQRENLNKKVPKMWAKGFVMFFIAKFCISFCFSIRNKNLYKIWPPFLLLCLFIFLSSRKAHKLESNM